MMTNAQQNTVEVLKALCAPFHVDAPEGPYERAIKVTVFGIGPDDAVRADGGNAEFMLQVNGGLTLVSLEDHWPTGVEELKAAIDRYYDLGNITGGALHITTDDGNVSDSSVQFCLDHAAAEGDRDAVRIATGLLRLDLEDRMEACNMSEHERERARERGV